MLLACLTKYAIRTGCFTNPRLSNNAFVSPFTLPYIRMLVQELVMPDMKLVTHLLYCIVRELP